MGEVIHGDYAGFVAASGLDAVTQYELWKAIWSALNDRNLYELAHALERHDGFLDRFVPLTFLGNHDVTRIASRLADPRHLGAALAVLLTCGGTPAIYAGDEQGFRGVKEEREGGDDAVRPEFPATPAGLRRRAGRPTACTGTWPGCAAPIPGCTGRASGSTIWPTGRWWRGRTRTGTRSCSRSTSTTHRPPCLPRGGGPSRRGPGR